MMGNKHKYKEIDPVQYAELGLLRNRRGEPVSLQYVHRLLKNDVPLPGVVEVVKYSRFYVLRVEMFKR